MQTIDWPLWQERFRQHLKVRYPSSDTVNNYTRGLCRFVEFAQATGFVSLGDILAEHLEEYRLFLYYRRQPRSGAPLTVGTQIAHLVSLKVFFRFLVMEGYVVFDPAAKLELPRLRKRLPTVLTEAEVLILLEAPKLALPGGVRDRAILELLYGSALRNQELCALVLPGIDLAARTLHLAIAKGDKPRVVPFGHQAEHWLGRYLEEVRPQWLRNAKVTHVFLDRWGQNGLSRAGLSGIVRGLAKAAGFKKQVTPHTLRHSCATHMLARGADLRHLQQLLGHASPSTTEHYTRVELTDLRRVLSRCHPLERRR